MTIIEKIISIYRESARKNAEIEQRLLGRKERQQNCQHNNGFTFLPHNRAIPPMGSCNDCMAEVSLDVILNKYIKKLEMTTKENNGI